MALSRTRPQTILGDDKLGCKDNIITPYIAEFINTLTNVTYLYYAFHGIRSNSNRKDAILRNLPYLGIALVGIGSAVFHSTLINYLQWCKFPRESLVAGPLDLSFYSEFQTSVEDISVLFYCSRWTAHRPLKSDGITQLAGYQGKKHIFDSEADKLPGDELSMHIATLTVLHRVMTFDKSLTLTISSGLISALLMIAFIAWHCMTDELIVHSILFGVMIVAVGIKTRTIIGRRVPDKAVRREVRKLATWGSVFFIGGFVLWNVDQMICGTLTSIKRAIGMPWSFVFELHGWWHVFTGMGAYIFIALVEYLTSEEAGQPLGNNFAWPVAKIVNCSAGSKPATNGAAVNNAVKEHGNGHVVNGHLNGCANGVKANGKKAC
ncbi:Alkaline ceramidase YDC1 [Hyphodiscus hymeniophilus]|uniref:Alkaline ceramidase YDC1 n=1 Tax=Hyphodiscus hymeniophilus TaxID=353542 RepID=A0A9P6VQK0_9HELO|nr:Alkaline ceramidase YDC1 [Hyphodiscus hymeniophilus]